MNQQFTVKDLYMCLAIAADLIVPFGSIPMPASCSNGSLKGGTVHILVERYAYIGQWLKVQLPCKEAKEDAFFEPFDSLSKVVHEHPIDPNLGEFIFAAYDVRMTYRGEMLATGYFTDTGRRFDQAFGNFEVWRVTDKFLSEFAAANPRAVKKACAKAA